MTWMCLKCGEMNYTIRSNMTTKQIEELHKKESEGIDPFSTCRYCKKVRDDGS